MSDNSLGTLAEAREKKKKEQERIKKEQREESRKKWIPLSALIVTNVIFLSLDVRAVQAVYLLTRSELLAGVTMLISGGLALYWFDILLPHSRRHKNTEQRNISVAGTALGIILSGILAFADYIIGTGTSFNTMWSSILWGTVVFLTVLQGVFIGWWYVIDKHIEAEAKQQEAHAELSDQRDEAEVLTAKLKGMSEILSTLGTLNKEFGADNVKTVADLLGIAMPAGMRTYAAPAVTTPRIAPDAQNAPTTTNYTLQDLERVSGLSVGQIKAKFGDFDSFAPWCADQFDQISGKNMRRIWYQEIANPQNPPRKP